MRQYNLSSRGICSTLNSLLGIYTLQSTKKEKVYINSNKSPFFKGVNFFDIFKPNEIFTDHISDEIKVIREKMIRKWARENPRHALKKKQVTRVFTYQDDVHDEIFNIVSGLNLPVKYACFHIRRGDKVGEKLYCWSQKTGKFEADRFEFPDYLKHVPSLETLFIMTDDYKCIQEAREYISVNRLPHKIICLTTESQDGHSQTLNEQHKRVYTKQELVQFFTEIEIAKRSQVFIGTRSSNVYRYIKATCTNRTRFISLD